MRAGIALGSNVGDRLANLRRGRAAIAGLPKSRELGASAVYETQPVGCAADDPPFLNAAIEIDFDDSPIALLMQLREIERDLGRVAQARRNAPRTIDLDLLYCGDSAEIEFDSATLTLPHPRLHERRFVLTPLADIRPDLLLPNQTRSIREILAQLGDSARVVRASEQW